MLQDQSLAILALPTQRPEFNSIEHLLDLNLSVKFAAKPVEIRENLNI